MLSRGLKPAELADALRCDLAPIYEWLNGTDLPRPHNIIKIADVLFVDKQELLGSFPVGD
jgi:transcriptional regulator with XRE-family HTH domain